MMKKLLALLLCLLSFCSCALSETTENDPLVLVKGIYDDHMYSELFYDEQGRVTLELTYQKYKVSNRYVYTYVDLPDGGVMAQIHNELSPNYYTALIFDVQGNCIEKSEYYKKNAASPDEVYQESNRKDYSIFTHDEEGRILTYTYYNKMAYQTTVHTYTYDENGNRTSYEKVSKDNGTVYASYTYAYDENGHLIQRTGDGNTTDFEYRETYTYDNLLESVWIQPNRYNIQYEYDSATRKLLQVTIENTLALLPAEMYKADSQLLGLCSDNKIVLMPLSEALKRVPNE